VKRPTKDENYSIVKDQYFSCFFFLFQHFKTPSRSDGVKKLTQNKCLTSF
jgi:hypothetical protein